jgi:hypothetical protein
MLAGLNAKVVPATEMEALPEPVRLLASVAEIVNVKFPAWVGVPETAPEGSIFKPGGNAPIVIANVYGAVPAMATACEE